MVFAVSRPFPGRFAGGLGAQTLKDSPPHPNTKVMGETTELGGGRRLRDALLQGWRPEPQPAMVSLAYNEQVYALASVEVLQFGGGDPAGFLGQPSPDSAPGWMPVDHGTVHLTSFRFAFQLSHQFANIPYQSIADAYCDDDGLCVWQHQRAPLKLRLADPEWHFVLFRWLAYGEPRPLAS